MGTEARQDVIANNISNAATPGFRRQEPVQQGFHEIFVSESRRAHFFDQSRGPGGGARMLSTFTDLRSGIMTETDNPLNVAVSGPGYLAVDTPQGERYTRAGMMKVNDLGNLVTSDGYTVQNAAGGAINVAEGNVEIARDGTVNVNGQFAGRLRLMEPAEPRGMIRMGDSLFMAAPDVPMADATETTVRQNFLEQSNVRVPEEMLKLMLGSRTYEANARMVQAIDDTLGRLIDQVAMP